MQILLTAATPFEIAPTVSWLREHCVRTTENLLHFENVTVEVCFTGIGMMATGFALGHRFGRGERPQLAIQAGIGGAIDPDLKLGEVVRITAETLGDLGAEDADGSFLTLREIGLPPGAPFNDAGTLVPEEVAHLPFRACTGLTVNRVSGSATTIKQRRSQFPAAAVESMEGAAFFYACQQAGISPLQLRAISNYVEPRQRENWQIGLAIEQLNVALQQVLIPFLPGKH